MKFFVTGTDTGVGKTMISSWLCLHTAYPYFKPIQTGSELGTDSEEIKKLAGVYTYKESYIYKNALSPHLASSIENEEIDVEKIILPQTHNLIIEGAGGLLVPINKQILMIDLIKKLTTPVILTARTTLGTINHTLLSIEALRARNIPIAGVILNGPENDENRHAIEYYGDVSVIATLPPLITVTKSSLQKISFTHELKKIFGI